MSGLSVMDYLEKQKSTAEKTSISKKQKEPSAKPTNQEEFEIDDGKKLVISYGENVSMNHLRTVSDNLTQNQTKTFVLVFSDISGKRSFIIRKTKDLQQDISAIAKSFAKEINGSAGGRADFAQGGCDTKLSPEKFIEKLKNLL